MNWIKVDNYEAMSRLGAEKIYRVIADAVGRGERVDIGLATGNTMIRLYELLAETLNRSRISPISSPVSFRFLSWSHGQADMEHTNG